MIDPASWKKLAAPIPPDQVQWRQDGRPVTRDGKYFARFVAYVDAQFVRERLDSVFEGQWNTRLELLPPMVADANGEANDEPCAFKCCLTVCGVMREDVGMGKDYKSAASDAFKRAAVRFGVAHELYSFGQNWVQVDADGKFAKPVEDPGEVYARRQQRGSGVKSAGNDQRVRPTVSEGVASGASTNPPARQQAAPEPAPLADEPEPSCPKCGGKMWDNRLSKRNPKAPDYKCRNRSCDGVVWPPKHGQQSAPTRGVDELPEDFNTFGSDEIPF